MYCHFAPFVWEPTGGTAIVAVVETALADLGAVLAASAAEMAPRAFTQLFQCEAIEDSSAFQGCVSAMVARLDPLRPA
jgi:hypothetical protein